jgi:hypothetical protein
LDRGAHEAACAVVLQRARFDAERGAQLGRFDVEQELHAKVLDKLLIGRAAHSSKLTA